MSRLFKDPLNVEGLFIWVGHSRKEQSRSHMFAAAAAVAAATPPPPLSSHCRLQVIRMAPRTQDMAWHGHLHVGDSIGGLEY